MSKLVVGWNPDSNSEAFTKFAKLVFKKNPDVVIKSLTDAKEVLKYTTDKNGIALYHLIETVDSSEEGAKAFNKFLKKVVVVDANIMLELKTGIFNAINKTVDVNAEVNKLVTELKQMNKEIISSDLGKIAKKFFDKPKLVLIG